MKSKLLKRAGAIFLSMALCLTMMPAEALADDTTATASGGTIGADATEDTIKSVFAENNATYSEVDGVKTITLNNDLIVSSTVQFTGGTWTMNLGNHTLTGSDGTTTAIGTCPLTVTGGTVTITNGALSGGNYGVGTNAGGKGLSISNGGVAKIGSGVKISGGNGASNSQSPSEGGYGIDCFGGVVEIGADTEITGGNGSGGSGSAGGSGLNIIGGIGKILGSITVTGGSNGNSTSASARSTNNSVVYENGTWTVSGTLSSLPADLTIGENEKLDIPSGASLTVSSGKKLTNNGEITVSGTLTNNSQIINRGTISGTGTLTGSGSFTNSGTINVATNTFGNNTVAGAFNITGGSSDTNYTYSDGVLTVNNGANLTISMASDATTPTSDRIVIAENATATITLNGVSITVPQEKSAIEIPSGSTLTLILPTGSENSLTGGSNSPSGYTGGAGIQVPSGATLNVKCSESDNNHICNDSTCGKLSANGNNGGAGIGGKPNENCGTITIVGGVITANGYAAGIGGGDHGSGGNITITGGIVTASGSSGAGIGGAGTNGPGGTVTITGGVVEATGAGGGAGIGGGWESAGGTVTITGGVVTATVDNGGGAGAGIGGGYTAQDHGTFSTSTESATGNAVVFASSNLEGNEIGDDDDTSNWSGVIFQGKEGKVYGNVALSDSFEIPSGYTLEIPDGVTLTIPENITVTNNGTIKLVDGGKVESTSQVSGSGTIQQLYTVTFAMNGHGTALDNILVAKDSTITQPTAPTAEGYIFGGWYKDSNLQTPWNYDTDTVTGKTTLYAKWTQDSTGGSTSGGSTRYTITASAGAGGSISPSGTVSVLRGQDKTFAITADEGYVISDVLIDGKSVGAESGYTFENVKASHTIEAVFAKSGETLEAEKNARLKAGVENTTIRLKSTLGDGFVRLNWTKSKGYKVDYYQVFKSTKRYSGYGTESYFDTRQGGLTGWYKNTKELKKGTRYYYKVRGVRDIAGETVYTQWSTKAWRLVK